MLSKNNLKGTLSTELGQLTNLERFTVEIAELTGTIPTEVGLMERLYEFAVGLNFLEGPIPTEFGNLGFLCKSSSNLIVCFKPSL